MSGALLQGRAVTWCMSVYSRVLDAIGHAFFLRFAYCQGRYSQIPHSIPGSTFSKPLRKISHLRTILDNMWLNTNLLLHDLTTTPSNNVRHDVKMNMLITIIIALLFPNSRL